MTKFTVERPKILKKLYKINAANNDLLLAPPAEECNYMKKVPAAQKPTKALKSELQGIIRISKGATFVEKNNKTWVMKGKTLKCT